VKLINEIYIYMEEEKPLNHLNRKVQCKEVKNTTSLLSVIMLLIERHVSAYSETIIKPNKYSL